MVPQLSWQSKGLKILVSPVRFLVAPLEPKVKINKTLQINDLRRFSFVKNRHFWCKMTQFSVLFMDIFWIPQKCTLIASYFAIFQYLTAISTIQYPAILSGISVYSCTYQQCVHKQHTNCAVFRYSSTSYNDFNHLIPGTFCRVFSSISVHTNNMSIKMYTIFSFSRNPYSPISTILTTSPDIEAQLKLIKLCKRALFQ